MQVYIAEDSEGAKIVNYSNGDLDVLADPSASQWSDETLGTFLGELAAHADDFLTISDFKAKAVHQLTVPKSVWSLSSFDEEHSPESMEVFKSHFSCDSSVLKEGMTVKAPEDCTLREKCEEIGCTFVPNGTGYQPLRITLTECPRHTVRNSCVRKLTS